MTPILADSATFFIRSSSFLWESTLYDKCVWFASPWQPVCRPGWSGSTPMTWSWSPPARESPGTARLEARRGRRTPRTAARTSYPAPSTGTSRHPHLENIPSSVHISSENNVFLQNMFWKSPWKFLGVCLNSDIQICLKSTLFCLINKTGAYHINAFEYPYLFFEW